MIRQKVDLGIEKQICIALATSKPFLAMSADLVAPDLLQTKYGAQVARWCVEHYRQYGEAPGKTLETIYHAWVAKEQPKNGDLEAVTDFLEHLSDLYDNSPPINVPHLTEATANYLTQRKAQALVDIVQTHLMRGEVKEAQNAIEDWSAVEAMQTEAYDMLGGKPLAAKTYAQPQEVLIEFPKPADRFFGRALRRGALVGIQGIEKLGKTTWCMEFAYRGVRCRRRVALFQVGDETEEEINKRWDTRIAGLPVVAQAFDYPVDFTVENLGTKTACPAVTTQHRDLPGITERDAWKAHKIFRKRHHIDAGACVIKAWNYPSGTISASGVDAALTREYEKTGFDPEVIIIDYADILAPEDPRQDLRHQINATWQRLRRMAQEWYACVLSPTQADAEAYGAHLQTMKNFSNDKRKNAHVTAMLGLNQTIEEKEQNVMRLNWLLKRGEHFNPKRCLWVAGCPALGMALVRSVY